MFTTDNDKILKVMSPRGKKNIFSNHCNFEPFTLPKGPEKHLKKATKNGGFQ